MKVSEPQFSPKTELLHSIKDLPRKHINLVRTLLYFYVVLVACPIRYWSLQDLHETWPFALNYAHAHGINTIFTSGPLGYLIFPVLAQNLASALSFQFALWLALGAIFADVFFRSGLPLRNLVLFSICFGLSAPLFWFDYLGLENLMLSGALLLLVMFHRRGSIVRYLGALLLVAPLVFFKLTAAMIGLSAIAGFLIDRLIERRWRAMPEAALAIITISLTVAGLSLFLTPSVPLFLKYLEGSANIAGGYSSAMSIIGVSTELLCAAEAIAVVAIMLWQTERRNLSPVRFFLLLLAFPLLVSFKHGFVRQDYTHVSNFFSFVALSLALISFSVRLQGNRLRIVAPLMIVFFVIWQDTVHLASLFISESTGVRAASTLLQALTPSRLRETLDASTVALPEASRIEPELAAVVGDRSVAPLSIEFTNLATAQMHLELYPVVQRYSAYTPYLDQLNAAWIRDSGPKFLLFDGKTIDSRDPWLETPAMWLEVYKWYNTRDLGPRNLLLERRPSPRFRDLEVIEHTSIKLPGTLSLPISPNPLFWAMKCQYNIEGTARKLLFRVPAISASIHETTGAYRFVRVLPEVLVNPAMGNYLPANLEQFAALFQPNTEPVASIDSISFEGLGLKSLTPTCAVEILRATQ